MKIKALIPLPDHPFVAVVIPVYNEERYIACCLESVIAQEYPAGRLEIVVVDGMSTDRTRQIVAEFQARHPRVKLLDNPRRIIPAAMNIGICHAREADVIVRVDGHCLLEPDYIRQCVHYLRQTGAGNVGGLQRAKGMHYVAQAIAMTVSSPLAAGDAKYRHTAKEGYVDTVYLGAFPRQVFEHVGLFNETLLRNEDYELNYRLRQAGFRIFVSPAIRSWYLTRESLRALWSQYCQYGYWKIQMLRLHPRSVRIRQIMAPTFVLSLMVSGSLGLIIRPVASLFILIVGIYLMTALAFAIVTARRHGWRYLPILPVTLATIHFSWGLGFLWGLVHPPTLRCGADYSR